MIDPKNEVLIDFAEAAKNLPRKPSGKAVHVRTVARWALYGIRGIRLDSLCIGGRRVTSKEACHRFFEALTESANQAMNPKSAAPVATTSDACRALLAAKGLL